MKPPQDLTVEQVTERLRGSQPLSESDARAIEDRYRREAGDLADAEGFVRWLVFRGCIMESQADTLLLGRSAARAVPAAAPRPAAPPEEPTLRAAIVAPAQPRAAVPIARGPDIPVQIVAPPAPPVAAAPGSLATDRSPAASDITVELVPLWERPAPAPIPEPTAAPPSTNVWLYFFLGALGMLIVQFAGWLAAQIVSRIL